MRHPLCIVTVAAATTMLTSRAALAQAPAPPPPGPIHSGVTYVGSFFEFLWDDDVKTPADGAKLGHTEVLTGVDATLGHMLSDHWGLQLHAGVSRDDLKTYTQDINSQGVTLENVDREVFAAPALRYYAAVSDETYLFAAFRAQVGFGFVNSQFFDPKQTTVLSADYHQIAATVNVSPGVTSFLTRNLAAEASLGILGFTIVRGSNDRGFSVHHETFQFLLYRTSLNIGLVWYFDG
jgi:hypothetical protein